MDGWALKEPIFAIATCIPLAFIAIRHTFRKVVMKSYAIYISPGKVPKLSVFNPFILIQFSPNSFSGIGAITFSFFMPGCNNRISSSKKRHAMLSGSLIFQVPVLSTFVYTL